MRHTGNRIEGSNPSLSANFPQVPTGDYFRSDCLGSTGMDRAFIANLLTKDHRADMLVCFISLVP
jgi:hypothetical protein